MPIMQFLNPLRSCGRKAVGPWAVALADSHSKRPLRRFPPQFWCANLPDGIETFCCVIVDSLSIIPLAEHRPRLGIRPAFFGE